MKSYAEKDKQDLVMFTFAFLTLAGSIAACAFRYSRNYEQESRMGVERQLSAVAELKVGELVHPALKGGSDET